MINVIKLLFVCFILIFCHGCSYKKSYVDRNKNGFSVPSASEVSVTDPDVETYVQKILDNPQSPDIFNEVPGYFNFYGIVASGSYITIKGYTKVVGGVYALGNIITYNGVIIVEDIECLNKTRDALQPETGPDVLNVFKSHSNPTLKRPVNINGIPSRTRILRYGEIQGSEGLFAESSF